MIGVETAVDYVLDFQSLENELQFVFWKKWFIPLVKKAIDIVWKNPVWIIFAHLEPNDFVIKKFECLTLLLLVSGMFFSKFVENFPFSQLEKNSLQCCQESTEKHLKID